jgi:hypothetical protein
MYTNVYFHGINHADIIIAVRNACSTVARKLERTKALQRSRHIYEDNIKMDLKEMGRAFMV